MYLKKKVQQLEKMTVQPWFLFGATLLDVAAETSVVSIVCQQSKSYVCSCHGKVLSFTIDFGLGFSCSEGSSKVNSSLQVHY